MLWRKVKLIARAWELRAYALFKAWHYYNLAAGLDFRHVCPKCTRSFDPVEHLGCPRCRILYGRGEQGRKQRLLYRFLVWRMSR